MPAATKPTNVELRRVVSDAAWQVMHTSQFPASIDRMIDEITAAVAHLLEDGLATGGLIDPAKAPRINER